MIQTKLRFPLAVLLATVLPFLASCTGPPPPATRPVETFGWRPGDPRTSDRLAVLLPGRESRGADFVKKGFDRLVRDTMKTVDVVAVDAHPGYYRDGLLPRVLSEDVLVPAQNAGYREIWIIGLSMGGVGALATLKERPELVDAVVVLGPFLGKDEILEKARRLGVEAGRAERSTIPVDAFFEELWGWLQQPDPHRAPIFLGFGASDRYRNGHRQLAGILPSSRVVEIPGGHDWTTWKRALERLLVPPSPTN